MANPVDRNVRVRVLDSIKPEDWLVWKRYFSNLARMWAWGNDRFRGELITAMDGDAARATADIDLAGLNQNECLAAYEERFITRAGSELAETSFRRAKQGEDSADETILQFHARCRELFVRAYPGQATEGDGLARNLRNIFTFGLSDTKITEYVYDRRPDTYTDCLSYAQEKYSTIQILEDKKKTGGNVNAMGGALPNTPTNSDQGGPRGPCHGCLQHGHYARNCPVLLRLKERGICRLTQNTDRRTVNNNAANRGRGRNKNNQRGAGAQRRVGALGDPEASEDEGIQEQENNQEVDASGNLAALSL